MTPEEILAALRENTAELGDRDDLFDQRLALWQQARALDPPVPIDDLAAASNISAAAISVALTKARKAAGEPIRQGNYGRAAAGG